MGYTTDFKGRFSLSRKLYPTHAAYLSAFAGIRHMWRDPKLLEDPRSLKIKDWRGGIELSSEAFFEKVQASEGLRRSVGLPLGDYGEYWIGNRADHGQTRDSSILDYNSPPPGVPGLWCQWAPSDDGLFIEWDGGEKFYNYVEWLRFLDDRFLRPWGYKLSGRVQYQGEHEDDFGVLAVIGGVIVRIDGADR